MGAMWIMFQPEEPDDFVIATGVKHSVREFVETAFAEAGIHLEWSGKDREEKGVDYSNGKALVLINPRYFRPAEVDSLLGDSSKARHFLGWEPTVRFRELVKSWSSPISRRPSASSTSRRADSRLRATMNNSRKIYVAGHTGLVGSAILRRLGTLGYGRIVTCTSRELDLRDQAATLAFFERERPEYVFLAAAKVGGILANDTYKAEFIYDNLMIAANVINAAHRFGVVKLLNLGSSCIYPKLAPQPLREEYLLSGPLEPTNEPYAIAKITGIKLCRYFNEQYGTNFISVMPTNLYGPGDNFDLNGAALLPALIRKIHEAKSNGSPVTIWGDGAPMREFLYVDDLAEALAFLMEQGDAKNVGEIINVGVGIDCSIRELAQTIARVIGFGESSSTTAPNRTAAASFST